MKLLTTRPKGFTIVELLIVIVVIAIIASITIVAYNGMQQRANNTQTVQAVKEFIKAFNLYAQDNGGYPQLTGCLGENYPAPNNRCLSQSGAAECFGMGAATSMVVNDALKPYMNNRVPNISKQAVPCAATAYIGGYASYDSTNRTMRVWMVLNGDQGCPPMSPNVTSVTRSYVSDASLCRYVLGAL